MAAPGTTPPLESVTTPDMLPVTDCAQRKAGLMNRKLRSSKQGEQKSLKRIMKSLRFDMAFFLSRDRPYLKACLQASTCPVFLDRYKKASAADVWS
jgi:hypothetical protein